MSYKCEGCGVAQPVGHGPIRTVTQIRTLGDPEFDKLREEIAEEKNFCAPCAAPYKEAARQKEAARWGRALDTVEAAYGGMPAG